MCGTTKCLLRVERSIIGHKNSVFFGTRKSLLEKSREGLLGICSMAPFFSRLSMAFCRYSVLFLVRNCLSVRSSTVPNCLGKEFHSNRTPDPRILDDLHLPRGFCQACENPARRASAGFSSLLAGIFWRSSLLFRCERLSPCWLGSLAEELAAWLLRLEKFWFCWFCWPFRKDCLHSWLTGGPNLWCTNNLEVPGPPSVLAF